MTSETKQSAISFAGYDGKPVEARLELPAGPVRTFALLVHSFPPARGHDAAATIARGLASAGIASLRFGSSVPDVNEAFELTKQLSCQIKNLVLAADFLRDHYEPPHLLVGHSYAGISVLTASQHISEVEAVATIGAPADPSNIAHLFGQSKEIGGNGNGKRHTKSETMHHVSLRSQLAQLNKPYLVLHSPIDEMIDVENATALFVAAKHPKSYLSLNKADHLLTSSRDATYAAHVIASWVTRFIDDEAEEKHDDNVAGVRATETLQGKFQQTVAAGTHRLIADEPEEFGGLDSGLTPYEFLSASLATCTSMAVRTYAERMKWNLGRVSVNVTHRKIHAKDCMECDDARRGSQAKIDAFQRTILVEGDVGEDLREKILEIADKCPVHRTLNAASVIQTTVAS